MTLDGNVRKTWSNSLLGTLSLAAVLASCASEQEMPIEQTEQAPVVEVQPEYQAPEVFTYANFLDHIGPNTGMVDDAMNFVSTNTADWVTPAATIYGCSRISGHPSDEEREARGMENTHIIDRLATENELGESISFQHNGETFVVSGCSRDWYQGEGVPSIDAHRMSSAYEDLKPAFLTIQVFDEDGLVREVSYDRTHAKGHSDVEIAPFTRDGQVKPEAERKVRHAYRSRLSVSERDESGDVKELPLQLGTMTEGEIDSVLSTVEIDMRAVLDYQTRISEERGERLGPFVDVGRTNSEGFTIFSYVVGKGDNPISIARRFDTLDEEAGDNYARTGFLNVVDVNNNALRNLQAGQTVYFKARQN